MITFKRHDHVYGRYWKIFLDDNIVGRIVPVGPGSLYAPSDFRVVRAHDGQQLAAERTLAAAKISAEELCQTGDLYAKPIKATAIELAEMRLDQKRRRRYMR